MKAMKAIELQFGNYVMISRTFEVGKVSTITKHKIGYHMADQEVRLYYARLNEIQPLEIIPGFLELIGFKRTDSVWTKTGENIYEYEFDGGKQNHIDIHKTKDGKIILTGNNKNCLLSTEVYFLHDLQQKLYDLNYRYDIKMNDVKELYKAYLLMNRQIDSMKLIADIEKDLVKEKVKIDLSTDTEKINYDL